MNIFESVDFLNEGKQAQEYEEKKWKREGRERLNSMSQAQRRWDRKESDRVKANGKNITGEKDKAILNTSPRYRETQKAFDADKHGTDMRDNLNARNAVDRHLRKHKNESVELENIEVFY